MTKSKLLGIIFFIGEKYGPQIHNPSNVKAKDFKWSNRHQWILIIDILRSFIIKKFKRLCRFLIRSYLLSQCPRSQGKYSSSCWHFRQHKWALKWRVFIVQQIRSFFQPQLVLILKKINQSAFVGKAAVRWLQLIAKWHCW